MCGRGVVAVQAPAVIAAHRLSGVSAVAERRGLDARGGVVRLGAGLCKLLLTDRIVYKGPNHRLFSY